MRPASSRRQFTNKRSLPEQAWDALKDSERLCFRVGSTSSQTGWDDYLVSTTDADAASSAPSVIITSGDKSAPPAMTTELLEVY